MIGDDLGAEKYISLQSQLEFKNIPILKNYNMSPFVYGEATFYPPHDASAKMNTMAELKRYTRGGIGYGIKIPVPGMGANFHFWYNIATFNTS